MNNCKKICLVDPLSPYGHKDVNNVLITELKKLGKLTVLCSDSLIDSKRKDVDYIQYDDSYFFIGKNSFINRIRLVNALKKMCSVINQGEFDVVIFSSYEVITVYIVFNILKIVDKKIYSNLYILNHSNIDDVRNSRIKTFAYKRLNRCITNLCYEEFIGKFIQENYNKKWKLLRHNINNYKKLYYDIDNSKIISFFEKKDYTYISILGELAFKDQIFKELIQLEESGYLQRKKIKIFIKEKNICKETNNIIFFNKYLSDTEYSYVLDKSHYISIIYNAKEYKYRVSGIFFDAVTFKKPIIYRKSLFFQEIRDRFGNFGIEYKDCMREVIDCIFNNNYRQLCAIMDEIYDYYSDKNVKEDLIKIIN